MLEKVEDDITLITKFMQLNLFVPKDNYFATFFIMIKMLSHNHNASSKGIKNIAKYIALVNKKD